MKNKLVLLFLVSALIGCASLGKNPTGIKSTQIKPMVLQKFPDIPIPLNFNLQTDKSYAFLNADIRLGLLKYSGKGYADDIIRFYKEQMPLYNWNLINIVEYEISVLNFEKRTENCSISIKPLGRRSEVIISVNPKSGKSIKSKPGKSNKPIKETPEKAAKEGSKTK